MYKFSEKWNHASCNIDLGATVDESQKRPAKTVYARSQGICDAALSNASMVRFAKGRSESVPKVSHSVYVLN